MLNNAIAEPELTVEDFTLFRDFIHEKSGMFFTENKMYLIKNRLVKRMAELGIKSYRDYFYNVKYDTSLREFNKLMDLMTTNETSFFRNEPQLLSFSDEVLPKIIEMKKNQAGKKRLRIWSAGCSTGEEPYTLAMILLEKLVPITDWNIEIIANDISEEVLHKARIGEYSGITLRNVQPAILTKYYEKHGENYRVKPEVKVLVKFSHMNLNDTRRLSVNTDLDTIFCRNVMIYFSDEVKKNLVRTFYNSLAPGGYFYIGHSETLHGISKAFKLVYFKNALVYQKEASKVSAGAGMSASPGIKLDKQPVGASGGAGRALDLLSKIKPIIVENKSLVTG